MAGLSIIRGSNGLLKTSNVYNNILNSLNYLENNVSQVYLTNNNTFIGWNKYDEYPIYSFETNLVHVIIEGKVYNKSPGILERELTQLANNFSDEVLKNWLIQADGDFLIYILNKKSNELIIFNDILGRLPIYYKKFNEGIIISRFPRFITEVSGEVKFDKIGMGEFLLLGYLLGDRTLFYDIKQLRPGSFILVNDSEVLIKTVNNFNFDFRTNEYKPFKQIIGEVSQLFSQGVLNRLNNNKLNLIALSSGLDSRTVAACLTKNKIPFETATMVFRNGAAREEIDIAQEISKLFNAKWHTFVLDPPKGRDIRTLLNLKEGMNYLAAACLLPFYHQLNQQFGGKINFITGDKGDKVTLSFDNPVYGLRSKDQLIEYIIGEHSMFSLEQVCSLLDVSKEDILQDLASLLESYPENSLNNKYIHFRAIEKSHKLAFQADDRHKRYYWSYCPLTSSPFVIYLFNCSNETKKMHRLFTALLQSYSNEAADVIYTNFKAPITSLKAKLFMASVYYLYPKVSYKLRNDLKNVFFGGNPVINRDSIFYKCIDEQFRNSINIANYFRISDSSSLKSYRMVLLQCFFTLTSLIDEYSSKNNVLNNHLEDIFDHMN